MLSPCLRSSPNFTLPPPSTENGLAEDNMDGCGEDKSKKVQSI